MMRILIGTFFLIIVLLIAFPIPHISGQSVIVVNNASTLRTLNTAAPTANLEIQARVAVQYSNSLRYLPVDNIPTPLQTLLDGVAQRVSVQYANSIRHLNLATMPDNFQNLLSSVSARIGFQYANSNRQFALVYPTVIPDPDPPVISPITSNSSGTSATIIWNTNEFTLYTLRYGTQSGNHTETIEEPLYAKQHTVTLAGLVSGGTYYLQVTSTDRNGNQSISPEFSFVVDPKPSSSSVFLPLVRRR